MYVSYLYFVCNAVYSKEIITAPPPLTGSPQLKSSVLRNLPILLPCFLAALLVLPAVTESWSHQRWPARGTTLRLGSGCQAFSSQYCQPSGGGAVAPWAGHFMTPVFSPSTPEMYQVFDTLGWAG